MKKSNRKEICIGDKVLWKENGKWDTVVLDANAWIYYTLVPEGFVKIKAINY